MIDPDTPLERVALVTWYLALGMGLTTKEVAQITKISRQGAWLMLCDMSRVIPIYQDEKHIWRRCQAVDM